MLGRRFLGVGLLAAVALGAGNATSAETELSKLQNAPVALRGKPDILCSWRVAGVCEGKQIRQVPYPESLDRISRATPASVRIYAESLAQRLVDQIGTPGKVRVEVAPCGQATARTYGDVILLCSEAFAAAMSQDGDIVVPPSEDALAWIVAHELAHVILGDTVNPYDRAGASSAMLLESSATVLWIGPFMIVNALTGAKRDAAVKRFEGLLNRTSAATRLARGTIAEAELKADRLGTDLLIAAGWSAQGALIGLQIVTGDAYSTVKPSVTWLSEDSPLSPAERSKALAAYLDQHYADHLIEITLPRTLPDVVEKMRSVAFDAMQAFDIYGNGFSFFFCGDGTAGWRTIERSQVGAGRTASCNDYIQPYTLFAETLDAISYRRAKRLTSGRRLDGPWTPVVNDFFLYIAEATNGLCMVYLLDGKEYLKGRAATSLDASQRIRIEQSAAALQTILAKDRVCNRGRFIGWSRAGALAAYAAVASRSSNRAYDATVLEGPWRDAVGERYLPFVEVVDRGLDGIVLPNGKMPSSPKRIVVRPGPNGPGMNGLLADLRRISARP